MKIQMHIGSKFWGLGAPRRRGRRRYAGRKVSGSEVGHLDHLDCLDGEGAVVTQGATEMHSNN